MYYNGSFVPATREIHIRNHLNTYIRIPDATIRTYNPGNSYGIEFRVMSRIIDSVPRQCVVVWRTEEGPVIGRKHTPCAPSVLILRTTRGDG